MRRRAFIKLIGGAATSLPLAAHAQQPAMPVIGYLSSKGEVAEAGITTAMRQGLRDSGFVEGKNVIFIYRWSYGDYSRLPQLASDLVNEKVDVIVASGLPGALAAKAATSTIPIVFRLAIDPVAFRLVQSFDRPGGNVTGVTMLFDPLTPKNFSFFMNWSLRRRRSAFSSIQTIKTRRPTRSALSMPRRHLVWISASWQLVARRILGWPSLPSAKRA